VTVNPCDIDPYNPDNSNANNTYSLPQLAAIAANKKDDRLIVKLLIAKNPTTPRGAKKETAVMI
jgi:hypothetical protein